MYIYIYMDLDDVCVVAILLFHVGNILNGVAF